MSDLVERVKVAIDGCYNGTKETTFEDGIRAAIAVMLEQLIVDLRAPDQKGDFCRKYIGAFARRYSIPLTNEEQT